MLAALSEYMSLHFENVPFKLWPKKAHSSIDGTCCGFHKPGPTLLLSHRALSDTGNLGQAKAVGLVCTM